MISQGDEVIASYEYDANMLSVADVDSVSEVAPVHILSVVHDPAGPDAGRERVVLAGQLDPTLHRLRILGREYTIDDGRWDAP